MEPFESCNLGCTRFKKERPAKYDFMPGYSQLMGRELFYFFMSKIVIFRASVFFQAPENEIL
jgi:hypothetical protein